MKKKSAHMAGQGRAGQGRAEQGDPFHHSKHSQHSLTHSYSQCSGSFYYCFIAFMWARYSMIELQYLSIIGGSHTVTALAARNIILYHTPHITLITLITSRCKRFYLSKKFFLVLSVHTFLVRFFHSSFSSFPLSLFSSFPSTSNFSPTDFLQQ